MDVRALGHNSARYIHVVTEALKLAFADRERHYGDAVVPVAELLAPAYARERAAQIRMDRAAPASPSPGDPRRHAASSPGGASACQTSIEAYCMVVSSVAQA